MFDKEIEAIAKCTELIKELDDDSKVRVLKYLIERFGIGMPKYQQTSNLVTNRIQGASDLNQEDISETTYVDSDEMDYPSLRDLVIKDYPKNESEWVLVYAFYSSKYGEDSFTRDDLLSEYDKSNRRTATRIKNLSQSISTGVKKDWIKSLNTKEYIFLDAGREYCKEILKGNSSGSTRKRTKKSKNNSED